MAIDTGVDQRTGAFRRLLAEAMVNEQARVDALVAFAQRTVLAATWPGQNQAVRTLTNKDGETAMPLFTGLDVLEDTATRFGWRNPDGSLPMRELDAREALLHALARGVQFVVVDIGCDHAVEFGRAEIEPLLAMMQSPKNAGPFAGAGEPQAAIMDAVRRSSRPPSMTSGRPRAPIAASAPEIDAPFAPPRPVSRPLSQPLPQRAASQPLGPNATVFDGTPLRAASQPMPDARPASQPMPGARPASQPMPGARPLSQQNMPAVRPGSQQNMPATRPLSRQNMPAAAAKLSGPLGDARPPSVMPPAMSGADAANGEAGDGEERESGERQRELGAGTLPDPLLQAMSTGLRGFPEVEWACVLTDGSDLPVVGVRVDPSFLNRVAQITDVLIASGEKAGQELQVLVLNTPELVKSARKNGRAFYPWKR